MSRISSHNPTQNLSSLAQTNAAARTASANGPFVDVDLGDGARPKAQTSWKDKISNAFGQVAFAGRVAGGVIAEGMQRADKAIVQPMEKRLSSAWAAVSDLGAKVADGLKSLRTPSRPATEAAVTALPPEGGRSKSEINEIAKGAYDVVMAQKDVFNPDGAHSALRGSELKASDNALRDLSTPVFKPVIDALVKELKGQRVGDFNLNRLPVGIEASKANEAADRFLATMTKINTALFGDGSDHALSRAAARFPDDFCRIVAEKRQAISDMGKGAHYERQFSNMLSGQDLSLRTLSLQLTNAAAAVAKSDPVLSENLKTVAMFLQFAAGPKGAEGEFTKDKVELPPARAGQIADMLKQTNHSLMRLGDLLAERGHAERPAQFQQMVETIEFDSFV